MRTAIIATATLAFLAPAGSVHAHVGHVGELAGHSHWIGIAAAAAAAAIAVAVATLGKKEDDADRETVADGVEGDGSEHEAKA